MNDYKRELEEYKEALAEYISVYDEHKKLKDVESLVIADKEALSKLEKMVKITRKIRRKLKKDLLNEQF